MKHFTSLFNINLASKPIFTSSLSKFGAILLSLSLVGLSSCATLSKEECMVGDWRSIGYNDGVAGHSAGRISQHQKACAKAGVTANYKLWEEGRQEGLTHYCTETKARQLGEQGRTMNAVCPASVANKLQRINAKAKRKYDLEQQISEDHRQIEKHQEELRKLRKGDMLDFTSESEARSYMLDLDDKIDYLYNRIRDNEIELSNLRVYP